MTLSIIHQHGNAISADSAIISTTNASANVIFFTLIFRYFSFFREMNVKQSAGFESFLALADLQLAAKGQLLSAFVHNAKIVQK